MSQEHVFDLLPAYVLGCMEEDDIQAVAAHLEMCECCQLGFQAYSRILEDLPLRIALSEPPPDIRQKILERASKEIVIRKPSSSSRDREIKLHNFMLVWSGLNLGIGLISVIVNMKFWRRLRAMEERFV